MKEQYNTGVSIWRQRIGYGVADLACNLIWQMITIYLMFFYTDVMGISAAQVGILFLLTRIVDGGADVLMGIAIDKTNTKWGKSRPYFLWGSIPFALFSILAFYVPDISENGKLIYAYATYLGLSLCYTVVNIPLASILPNLTSDAGERTMLATSRIIFSFIGATVVSSLTLPMVKVLGGESQAAGFLETMVIFAVVAAGMFIFTFRNVEEKVKVLQAHVTVKQAFSTLKGNYPWYIFAVNILFMWGAYFLQQGALVYYFTYYVSRPDLVSIIAGITAFVPIVGTFTAPFFARRMQKKTMFMIASGIHLAGIIIMILVGTSIVGLITATVVSAIGFGLRHAIYFSMQADPVDYAEWKTGINGAGLISAINGFLGKLAMAGAGALAGVLLTSGGYIPNQTQTPSALLAIRMNFLFIPASLVVISMLIMSFYKLDKIYPQIRAEIDARLLKRVAQENNGLLEKPLLHSV